MLYNEKSGSSGVSAALSVDKSETMRFTDHASSTTSTPLNPLESTFMLADTTDRVEGFFSRPQRIATFEWTPSVGFNETINPWTLYFSNDKVRERLSNFAYLRCRLHVRFMINSTKFYYGRMLAAYRPMHLNDNLTVFRPGIQADFVEASQRPCIIMDPTSDQVGEMDLPFMYPKSMLSVPAREWERMGEITLADLTVLRNANGATDSVTVTVFAWAEDVTYSQPTSTVYSTEGEYFDGPISKPAHRVARFANHLANVPVIGLYARATDMVFSAGAAVAKLFGYSRPTIVEPVSNYNPYYGKELAVINKEDTCDPLSLDCKKEVPIDSRIIGATGEDHMAFVPLAKRETYITSFDWTPGSASNAFLFNLQVHPLQRTYEAPTIVHTTPAAWVASLFKYWRGSMKIRFEVVCSSFHRGRLRLVYDPVIQATDEYNVNYTHVMDLCSETDYTMTIGWASNLPYLVCDHLNSGNDSHSTTQFTERYGNGILSCYVINSLTTPSDSLDPVTVNVYVSMCDDFEVQDPIGTGLGQLQLDENVLFPPNILPSDPPTGIIPSPVLARTGPIVLGDISQQGGLNVVSTPSTGLTQSTNSYVLGANASSQVFQNDPGYAFTLSNLENGPNQVTLTFRTNNVALPADLVVGGVNVNFIEVTTGVYEAIFIDTPVVVGGAQQYPVTWGENLILILENSEVERDLAVQLVRAPDPSFSLGPFTNESSDQFGTYYSIPDGESLEIVNPGQAVTDLLARGDVVGGDVVFGSQIVEVRSSDFPTRLQPNPSPENGTNILVQNNSGGGILLYGYTWETQVYQTEGATFGCLVPEHDCSVVYNNEGAEEEELQSERAEINENAAGTVENLPQVSDVFFGEVPSSFRQVMKRYTMVRNLATEADERRRFVLYANPRNTARGQVRPSDVSLWLWIMAPYLGWKGSTRHKIIAETPYNSMVTISRLAEGSFEESEAVIGPNQQVNIAWEGSTTGILTRQVAEAVIPWYSNLRFRNCRIGNPDVTYESAPAFTVEIASLANRSAVVRQIAAGGEDYSLHFWVSTPIVNVLP